MGTAAELDTTPFPICTIIAIRIAFHYSVKQFIFFITFSLLETETTTMSTPTTPIVSVTNTNDETTVIEQSREESPSPLPIPPPQSMSSLNDDSMSPHHSPIVSSDDEADNDSDTAFSRSHTPSPDSTVAILMQYLTDTAEQLAEPIRVVNHTMRNVIVTRDRMIHRLSTATEPLTDEQREALIISLQEFAMEAENLGLPLIPIEIIEGFFERIRPRDASPEIIARDTFAIATTRLTLVPIVTQTREEQIIVHPVGAPPTFTVQADADVFNNSDSDSPDPESELPMNLFPQEFNSSNDENFDVRPPVITLTDRILEHYHVPTWEDTTTRRNYYRIWTLLTSWTFVNNYLHILNRHIRVDLIPIVNNFVNLTRRYRTPHEDRWVTLTIWDNLRWIYTLRGDVYTEEATRLTVAGHRICFIELRHQLALEAGVAWMHGSPSILDGPIPHSVELIQSLLHQANRTQNRTGWNVTALRQLQTEVNALVWRNDDFSRPNSNNDYQDAAVIALQMRNTIEGRDVPRRHGSQPTTTQLPSTWDNPGRTITWSPNNVSFPGEETAGTIGCYLCGDTHYTAEHHSRRRFERRNQSPPPSYPDTITPTRRTAYESIPEQPLASMSTNISREPPVYARPPIGRPLRSPTTPRRGCGSPTRRRPLRSRIAEGSHRQRRSSNEEMFLLDSDAEHNNNT